MTPSTLRGTLRRLWSGREPQHVARIMQVQQLHRLPHINSLQRLARRLPQLKARYRHIHRGHEPEETLDAFDRVDDDAQAV